ncbi:hypothetical protein XELAEV_18003503mg [Xenopus laevis]|nr:hypothetical protein XELAEV_18003503mg [Xenopus laevis]
MTPGKEMDTDSLAISNTSLSGHTIQKSCLGLHTSKDIDLRAHLLSLPSRQDIEKLIANTETDLKSEISVVHTELQLMGERYLQLEKFVNINTTNLSHVEKTLAQYDSRFLHLQNLLGDQENRSRRNNIRIKGLPESVAPQHLIFTITKLFNTLLGEPPGKSLTLQEPNSRTYLRQRCALKPILDLLKEHSNQYKWGYPFALTVIKNGKPFSVRCHKDISAILDNLNLPHI